MTAQNSANKSVFYKFLPYYLNKVKYLRPQLIMSIIFSVLSYPVFIVLGSIGCVLEADCQRLTGLYDGVVSNATNEQYAMYIAARDKIDLWSSFMIAEVLIGALCLAGLFVFTFVTTLRSFRYLYNKSVVDMDMSLPVDHNTRFFGDLAAVFTVNILPHLVAILLGQILLPFADFSAFDTQGDTQAIVEAIMGPMAFTGLFMCVMEIAITLLLISFCGRLAEACVYPILINFAIPVIHLMTINLVESGVYGAVLYPSAISAAAGSAYPITASSPLGMMIMTLYSMMSISCKGSVSDCGPIFRPEFGIPALLVTLACLAGAYFLIKYRRAERVGMPYVYRGMGLVIPGIVIFAITVPVSYFISINVRGQEDTMDYYSFTQNNIPGMIIGTIISTFILYIIMELISGRNFRKFGLSVAKWAGTLAACALICFGLNMANGFGAAYYVPNPDRVASASMSYYNSDSFGDRTAGLTKNQFRIKGMSGDDILQTIREVHDEIPKNNGDGASDGKYVNFYYVMKDGTQLERSYSVSSELFGEIRRKMVTPEGWYSSLFSLDEKELLNEGYSVNNIWLNNTVNVGSNKLLDAIWQDCQKINVDFIENEPSWKYADLYYDFRKEVNQKSMGSSMRVYDWMENTIAYLESIDIYVSAQFTGEGFYTAFILKNVSGLDDCELFGQSEGYSYSETMRMMDREKYEQYDYDMEFSYGRTTVSNPELNRLIEVCGSFDYYSYSSDRDTYTILLYKAYDLTDYAANYQNRDPVHLVVPPEYNDQAEALMQSCLVQEYIPEDTATAETESTYSVA